MKRVAFGALPVALAVCLPSASVAQGRPANLTTFLTESIGLRESDLTAVERGEPVVRALDRGERRDIAIFGIVAVDVPRDSYLRWLLDLQHSLRHPTQTQFGLFSTPATGPDIEILTIDRKDLADARTCQPGHRVFKLPAATRGPSSG